MDLGMRMFIAHDAERSNFGRRDCALGHTTARRADLKDAGGHFRYHRSGGAWKIRDDYVLRTSSIRIAVLLARRYGQLREYSNASVTSPEATEPGSNRHL